MERLLDSHKVETQKGNVRLDCNWCCEQQNPRGHTSVAIGLVLTVLLTATGCSVRKFAINKLGDSLANSGSTFASDNDPECNLCLARRLRYAAQLAHVLGVMNALALGSVLWRRSPATQGSVLWSTPRRGFPTHTPTNKVSGVVCLERCVTSPGQAGT